MNGFGKGQKVFIVDRVRTSTVDTKNSDAKDQLQMRVRPDEPKAGGGNSQRATEIGPVLEEILRSHWEHWGLNE